MSLGATYQELHRDGIRWGGTPAFILMGPVPIFLEA